MIHNQLWPNCPVAIEVNRHHNIWFKVPKRNANVTSSKVDDLRWMDWKAWHRGAQKLFCSSAHRCQNLVDIGQQFLQNHFLDFQDGKNDVNLDRAVWTAEWSKHSTADHWWCMVLGSNTEHSICAVWKGLDWEDTTRFNTTTFCYIRETPKVNTWLVISIATNVLSTIKVARDGPNCYLKISHGSKV